MAYNSTVSNPINIYIFQMIIPNFLVECTQYLQQKEEVHLLFESRKIIQSCFVNLHVDSNRKIEVREIIVQLKYVLVNMKYF